MNDYSRKYTARCTFFKVTLPPFPTPLPSGFGGMMSDDLG